MDTRLDKKTDSSLKIIMDASPVGIVAFGDDERIIYVNPLASRLFGKSANQVSGLRWGDLIDCPIRCDNFRMSDEAKKYPQCSMIRGLCGVLAGESSQEFREGEVCLERDSGRGIVWIQYKISSVVINGYRIAIMAIDDITDLKKAQGASIKSEQQLRNIMDNVVAMIGILAPDGTVMEVNRAALKAANLKMEDVKGKPFEQCYWCSWSMELQKKLRKAIQNAAAGTSSRYDEKIRVGEDEFRTIEFILSPVFDHQAYVSCLIFLANDITERKQTELALRRSEKNLKSELKAAEHLQKISTKLIQTEDAQALYEQIIHTAVVLLNADFGSLQMLYFDQGADGKLRLKAQTGFNGKAAEFWKWVTPSSRSACGKALKTEKRVVVADVQKCDFMADSEDMKTYIQTGVRAVQTTPLISRSGKMLGMLSTHWRRPHEPTLQELRNLDILARMAADLLERSKAREFLRESEEKYRSLIDQSMEMIFLHDLDGNISDVNKAAVEKTGYTREELLKLNVFALHPDQLNRHEIVSQWKNWSVGHHVTMEYQHLTKYGKVYPVEINTGKISIGGRELILALVQDITERKKAEQKLLDSEKRFRLLTTASSEVLYRMSPDWSEMRQLHSRGFLTNTERANPNWLQEYIYPEDQSHVTSCINEAIRTKSVFELEHRVRRLDGSVGWTFSRAIPLTDKTGEIVEWFGAASDITDRKQSEEALKQLNETLERRVAERTALAQARAKQLQTLAAEVISAEEKERRRIAELLHEDLQQVLAGAKFQLQACHDLPDKEKLADVENLLDEAIQKSRHLSHELSPPILHQLGLVPALKWLAQQMKKQFGLETQLEIKDQKPFENESIKICMFRAVQELLFNAVKHSGVKSAHLALYVSGDNFVITVSDRGCGFNPEILDNSHKKTGFGLITIKERASYIGGDLTVESVPGRGSRFILTVPFGMVDENKLPPEFSDADSYELYQK